MILLKSCYRHLVCAQLCQYSFQLPGNRTIENVGVGIEVDSEVLLFADHRISLICCLQGRDDEVTGDMETGDERERKSWRKTRSHTLLMFSASASQYLCTHCMCLTSKDISTWTNKAKERV